jgi:hypothetical protein
LCSAGAYQTHVISHVTHDNRLALANAVNPAKVSGPK